MSCKQTGNNVIVAAAPIADSFDFDAWAAAWDAANALTHAENLSNYSKIGCVFSSTAPGYTYETISDDQCLEDTVPTAELGDEQTSEFSFTTAYCPGGTFSTQLETWVKNKQRLFFHYRYPGNTEAQFGVSRHFTGKCRVWTPQSIEKKTFMKVEVTAIRQSIIHEGVHTS